MIVAPIFEVKLLTSRGGDISTISMLFTSGCLLAINAVFNTSQDVKPAGLGSLTQGARDKNLTKYLA